MSANTTLLDAAITETTQADVKEFERQRLEDQLVELHGRIRLNQIEAGRIISDLRKTFKHGGWVEYSEGLYKRLGISMKSAYRYVEAFEQSQTLGDELCQHAEIAGMSLNKPAVRQKLCDMKSAHPKKSAAEIVNLTNSEIAREKPILVSKPETFNTGDFIANVTRLRAELATLNQFTKQVRRRDIETETIDQVMATLESLEKDIADRKRRLADAVTEEAA